MKSLKESFSVDEEKLISELILKTKKYERLLNPEKKYFLSEKMNLINPTISKNNSEEIIKFVKELVESKEHLAVQSFYSEAKKFFKMEKNEEKKESSIDKTKEGIQNAIQEEDSEKEEKKEKASEEENSKEGGTQKEIQSRIDQQFSEAINKSTTELNFWKQNCKETRMHFSKKGESQNRSFFGYYNFHNFFNHFVILYERLKLMKSLTDRQGVFDFVKQVMMLSLTHVIDSELFEDVVGCLLSQYSGVFLNLEKILANIIKELPLHDIDKFVTSLNRKLFDSNRLAGESHEELPEQLRGFPNEVNEEEWLFLKTCYKLSSLTFKNKTNCKQSQIQSYINNNNLVNDHLLKFEFRTDDQVFVIHKVKSLFEHSPKQVVLTPSPPSPLSASLSPTPSSFLTIPEGLLN